jgi:exonuclease SbcC
MRILRLTIENLNSLRTRQTLEFDEPPLSQVGLFAITGDTGAGKTTLLDGITLAMYGQVPRHKDVKEVMSWGTSESLAEVEFEHAGQVYRSKWTLWRARGQMDGNFQGPKREVSRQDPQSGEFEIIAEKIREAEQAIEDITGLDYERFRRSVLLAQGDFAAFLDADARERSDLLERITGTETYSQLSVSAYQRFKLAETELAQSEQQLQGLALLSEEEQAALGRQLEEAQKEVKKLAKERKTLQVFAEAYQRLSVLEDRLAQGAAEAEELAATRTAKQSDFNRLQQSRKAHPVRAAWEKLAELQANRETRTALLDELAGELASAKNTLATLQQEHKDQAEKVASAKKEEAEAIPRWEEVTRLDAGLKDRRDRQKALGQKLADKKGQLANLEAGKKELEKQHADLEQELQEVIDWLSKQPNTGNLDESLPSLQSAAQVYDKAIADLKKYTELLQGLRKKQKAARIDLGKTEEELRKASALVEQEEEALRELLENQYAGDRQSVVRALTHDIEQLHRAGDKVAQLTEMVRAYDEQNVKVAALDDIIERLESEAVQLERSTMNLIDARDDSLHKKQYKERILQQQQQLVNYEQTRNQLEPGEPCPVCLSTEHPFRDQTWEPMLDEARSEFTAAEKRLSELEQDLRDQLFRQQKQYQELERLRQEREQANARLEELEVSMVPLRNQLEERRMLFAERQENLQKALTQLRADVSAKQEMRERVEKHNQQLDQLERQLQQLREKRQSRQSAADILEDRIGQGEVMVGEASEARERQKQLLVDGLKKLDLHPDWAHLSEQLAELNTRRQSFRTYTDRRTKLEKTQAVLQQQLEETNRNLEQALTDQQSLQEELEEINKWIEEQRTKRHALIPEGETPAQARDALQKKIRSLEQKVESIRTRLDQQTLEVERLQTRQSDQKTQLKTIAQQLADQEQAVLAEGKVLNLPTLAEIEAVLLSREEEAQIEKIQQELVQREAEVKRLQKERETERQDLQKQLKEAPDLATVNGKLEAIQEAYDEAQQVQGRVQERLANDATQRKKAGELTEKIDQKRAEFERWAKLNDIIGSADGKKFRAFAQGLTLEKLSHLANHHLQALNGRYLIRKRVGEELELDIVDTFQANNTRSMRTLSGGERFLVSLALALGLSDLAGRQVQISSLFIDEGFGTLDENSLDLAISTLENLQSTGKTIGVISHVPALKERIGVRIQVHKNSDGFSYWELIQ